MPSNSGYTDVEAGEFAHAPATHPTTNHQHPSPPPAYMEGSRGGASLAPAGSYVILAPSSSHAHYHRYNAGVAKVTGLLQISLGSVTGVMGLLALVLHAHHYFLDLPLWAGLLYLFGGVFGVASSKQQTFMIGLYLLFSIMSSLMAMVVIATEGHATFMEANTCECSIFQSSQMLYDATAAIVSCLEMLVTFVAMYHCMSGLGCCLCCQDTPQRESSHITLHQPALDFSNFPLPPAPIYSVLPPKASETKVPLE